MNVKECYEMMNADYNEVMHHLGSEQMISRFLKKYIDNDEMPKLEEALKNCQYKDAFICAHNMKGYGLNLSLTEFTETSSTLCEALRSGKPTEDVEPLLANLRNAHRKLNEVINNLD